MDTLLSDVFKTRIGELDAEISEREKERSRYTTWTESLPFKADDAAAMSVSTEDLENEQEYRYTIYFSAKTDAKVLRGMMRVVDRQMPFLFNRWEGGSLSAVKKRFADENASDRDLNKVNEKAMLDDDETPMIVRERKYYCSEYFYEWMVCADSVKELRKVGFGYDSEEERE